MSRSCVLRTGNPKLIEKHSQLWHHGCSSKCINNHVTLRVFLFEGSDSALGALSPKLHDNSAEELRGGSSKKKQGRHRRASAEVTPVQCRVMRVGGLDPSSLHCRVVCHFQNGPTFPNENTELVHGRRGTTGSSQKGNSVRSASASFN